MVIDFEDKLDDGRPIWFEADEFEAPDPSVGYGGAVTNYEARLIGTDFPVSLTDAEDQRLSCRAFEMWLEAVESDIPDEPDWV